MAGRRAGIGAQHPAIDHEVERLVPQITEIRHQIHAHPELGNREVATAALIADYLRAVGFDDIRTGVAHTGVVAVLRGEQPGPVVAVRADMDALPVTEETDVPFRSTRRTTYRGQEVGGSCTRAGMTCTPPCSSAWRRF